MADRRMGSRAMDDGQRPRSRYRGPVFFRESPVTSAEGFVAVISEGDFMREIDQTLPKFDTAREAWQHLADVRIADEDSPLSQVYETLVERAEDADAKPGVVIGPSGAGGGFERTTYAVVPITSGPPNRGGSDG